MKGIGAIFVIISLILLLGGCGGESPKPTKVPVPPAGKPGVPAKTPPPKVAEVKIEPPPVVTYTYDPKGKTNPFKPLVVEKPETPPPPKKEVVETKPALPPEPLTPLEKIELSQLKLVAIIWHIREPKAMVEDGTGKGYIIAKGTPIGKNKGTVTQIGATGVVITEKHEVTPGKPSPRDITLKLYGD